jgi:hypothetical protein
MSKTTNKFLPEVPERALRLVLDRDSMDRGGEWSVKCATIVQPAMSPRPIMSTRSGGAHQLRQIKAARRVSCHWSLQIT